MLRVRIEWRRRIPAVVGQVIVALVSDCINEIVDCALVRYDVKLGLQLFRVGDEEGFLKWAAKTSGVGGVAILCVRDEGETICIEENNSLLCH